MELVRDVVQRLVELLSWYLGLWGRGATALSGEFGLDLPAVFARFVGMFFGSVITYAFFRRVSKWDRKGDKPQPFPLKTAETPNEVVAKDTAKLLAVLLKVSLFVLLLLIVAMARG